MTTFPLPSDLLERLRQLAERDGDPAFAYARISKDVVAQGLGVQRQLKAQIELYERHNLRLVGVYVDNDISAFSGRRRPDYLAMIDDLGHGVAKVVTAWDADRVTRNNREGLDYIELSQKHDVVTLTIESGRWDLSTPAGRATAITRIAWARQESELKSDRIKEQKKQAAAAGKWRGGRRPYGFEPDGSTHRDAEAEMIRDCTRRLLAGETLYGLTRDLFGRGIMAPEGGRWAPANLRRMLLRPRNAGLIEVSGAAVGSAEWAPIVDPDSWRALVTLLTSDDRKPWADGNVSRVLVGSGVYRCYCGLTMFSGGTVQGRMRYRCISSHLYRTAPPIDDLVHRVIAGVLDKERGNLLPPTIDVAPLRERLHALEIRKGEIAEEFGDPDSDMTSAQFRIANERVTKKVREVEDEIERVSGGSALVGIADAANPGAAYRAATMDRQRAVIDDLAVVTVFRASGGRRPDGTYFDPDSVRIEPK